MDILLLHGLFGSLGHPSIIQSLAPANVLAPDLLGYGERQNYPTDELELSQQSDYVAQYVRQNANGLVHVVGHSVGGAVGLLLASDHPRLVQSYTSIEGNMTLKDAFWSADIASKPITHIESLMAGYRDNVSAWIGNAGVEADSRTIEVGKIWLDNQPASTIRAQANAVVSATGDAKYLSRFDDLLTHEIPIHLVAGEKSVEGWDLPSSIKEKSASMTVIPGRGHLMMLENPSEFGRELLRILA